MIKFIGFPNNRIVGRVLTRDLSAVKSAADNLSQKGGEDRMSKKNQHVVPRGNDWAVRGAGNSRDTSHHATQAEAIRAARGIAQNQGTELLIHRRNGQIRERDSHGNDKYPPLG